MWVYERAERLTTDLNGGEHALVYAPHLSKINPWIIYCCKGKYVGEWQGWPTRKIANENFEKFMHNTSGTELFNWKQ